MTIKRRTEKRTIDYSEVEKFIMTFWKDTKRSPTIREVQEGCGISSTSVTSYVLDALAEEGKIHFGHEKQARNIIPAVVIEALEVALK